MTNTSAVGRRSKRRCKKYLRGEGWIVADVEDNSKYSRCNDKFQVIDTGSGGREGVADLVAVRKGTVVPVQVTTGRPKTRADMQQAADRLGLMVQCWTWEKYEGFRVQDYWPDSNQTPVMDIRIDSEEVPKP